MPTCKPGRNLTFWATVASLTLFAVLLRTCPVPRWDIAALGGAALYLFTRRCRHDDHGPQPPAGGKASPHLYQPPTHSVG